MGVKMSSCFSVNTSLPPVLTSARPASCTVKGRLIPYEEFLLRLKNFCLSLGFTKAITLTSETLPAQDGRSADTTDSSWAAQNIPESVAQDLVIILSTKVPYEPNWGVYGGLPRPLIHERTDRRTDGAVSHFIAPYLAQYHFAQNHIYLTCKEAGKYLVTLPVDLIDEETDSSGKQLKIRLDKFTEPDDSGNAVPVMVTDSFLSFPLSEQFLQYLRENSFSWEAGKVQRIGALLSAELFVFKEIQKSGTDYGNSGNDGGKSSFVKTLLPDMNRIVTHANPQLRAAIIYLKNEFNRLVDELLHVQVDDRAANLLCVAGLDIDVASFKGRGQHYFVPWAAYWQQGGRQDLDPGNQLQQEDLFVALMSQGKQCYV